MQAAVAGGIGVVGGSMRHNLYPSDREVKQMLSYDDKLKLLHNTIMITATDWATFKSEMMAEYLQGKAAGLIAAYDIMTDDAEAYVEYRAMICL